jgi:hypothetical protein
MKTASQSRLIPPLKSRFEDECKKYGLNPNKTTLAELASKKAGYDRTLSSKELSEVDPNWTLKVY